MKKMHAAYTRAIIELNKWTSCTHLGRLMIKNMHAVYTRASMVSDFLNPTLLGSRLIKIFWICWVSLAIHMIL